MAQTLKDLRIAAFLSQKEVADKLHVTISAVSNWERGAKTPTLTNMRRLAEVYQVLPQIVAEAVKATASQSDSED